MSLHAQLANKHVLRPGDDSTLEQMLARARDEVWSEYGHAALVEFTLNGVTVNIRADSDPVLIARDYYQAMRSGSTVRAVGPYPVAEPTDDRRGW